MKEKLLSNFIQTAITIPVSFSTNEQSSSTMQGIKNWLRSSMIQQRYLNLYCLILKQIIKFVKY